MRRILVGMVLLGATALLGLLAWVGYTQHATRTELLAIRQAITPGMLRDDVVRVIKERVRHTTFPGDSPGVPIVVVTEGGSPVQWVLCISFKDDHAVAVRIGTEDSLYEKPRGAPRDLVWGPESADSPWSRPGVSPEARE